MGLIKNPAEVKFEPIMKCLIYGQPGIGKSSAAVSAPNPVLLDCDNGVHRMQPNHRPPFLPVKSYDDVLKVLNEEVAGFDSIVIDTAGKLLDYMAQWLISNNPKLGRKDGMLTLQGYGSRKYEFINLLKRVTTMGKHLIFVAHELEERNGDDRIIRPEVGGSSGADLIKELDIVGYMEAIGRKRTISFSPSDKYYAKNSARLPEIIDVPELSDGQDNVFLVGIIEKWKAALNAEGEQKQQYDELMDKLTSKIEKVENCEQANRAIKGLAATKHIWDSKKRSWNLLKLRSEKLDLIWDGKAKEFIEQPEQAPPEEEGPPPTEEEGVNW